MKKILSLMLSKVLLNLSKSERLNFTEVTKQMTSIQEMIFWLNDLSYQKMEELLAKKELLNADVRLATQELNRLKSSIETGKKDLLVIQDTHRVFYDDLEDIKQQIAELNVPQPPNTLQEDKYMHDLEWHLLNTRNGAHS